MKEEKGYLDIITKNFAVSLAMLIAIGVIQINDYYWYYFNFDVMPYLSPSEILTQSFISLGNFSIINLASTIASVGFIVLIFVTVADAALDRSLLELNDESISVNDQLLLMIASTAAIIIFSQIHPDNKFSWGLTIVGREIEPIIFFLATLVARSLLSLVNLWRNKENSSIKHYYVNLKYSTLYFILFSFSFLICSQQSYKLEAALIKDNRYYSGTVIKTSDSTYVSNNKASYIGRTTNDVFIYNFKEKSVFVIPTSEVKSIKLVTRN